MVVMIREYNISYRHIVITSYIVVKYKLNHMGLYYSGPKIVKYQQFHMVQPNFTNRNLFFANITMIPFFIS